MPRPETPYAEPEIPPSRVPSRRGLYARLGVATLVLAVVLAAYATWPDDPSTAAPEDRAVPGVTPTPPEPPP